MRLRILFRAFLYTFCAFSQYLEMRFRGQLMRFRRTGHRGDSFGWPRSQDHSSFREWPQ